MVTLRSSKTLAAGAGLAFTAAAGAQLQRRHRHVVERDPANARLRSPRRGRVSSARSADGTELHVEVFGEEDRPAIVLAHGWTEQLIYWTLVIDNLLDRGFRVVAFDLRGHGDSEPAVDGDYSLDRFGEDLEAVLAAACRGGERPLVAGHSLGAMSIVAWAAHHDVGGRVSAAALLNTGVGGLLAEGLLIPVPWLARALGRTPLARGVLAAKGPLPGFSTPVTHALIRYVAFGPTATPAQVAFYERMLVACPPDVRSTVGIALSEMDLYEAVPRLSVPTLVMAGANDKLTPPSHARRIAQELPALHRLIVLPETGHMG
ncbi:MAG: alpha/beta hydrolase, partial [Actinomycetota bacterium]|nr:alpha/beta hydrolase [Actinomycetota bacterium]